MISTFKNFFNHATISKAAFRLLQILFGYDFGYFLYKSLKIKFIAKLFCLLQSILVAFLLINAVYHRINEVALFWYCIFVFQYVSLVFSLTLFPSDTTLSRFQNELSRIDLALKSNDANSSERKWKIIILIFLATHRITIITYFFIAIDIFMKPVWLTITFLLMIISIDFVALFFILMFYSLYLRIYLLNELVLKSDTVQIICYRHLYMLIVRVTEKYKRIFNAPVSKLYLCYRNM